jgi:MPN domain-containing protein
MDYSSLFSHMTPSKLQEMNSLFSQSKYPGIPDPLAKSTLAANNAYLSPSLMKLQQEALNTRLMKPPKSSSSSSSSKVDTPPLMGMSSPLSEKRSTPTKSLRDSPAPPKYNFSAADLAISSHVPSASSTPTDFSRKSTPTPPVDLAMKERSVPPKKRMEFSSIAELVAPSPTKRQKYAEEDNDEEPAVLNLSNN